MFGDLFDLGGEIFKDAVDIVSAPVKIAGHVVHGVTKPIADVANDVVDSVDELFDEDD